MVGVGEIVLLLTLLVVLKIGHGVGGIERAVIVQFAVASFGRKQSGHFQTSCTRLLPSNKDAAARYTG